MKINKKEKRLVSNTLYLYFMQFLSQLLNMLTIPYLTRILGPIIYGKIGIALAYMSYVQIIMNFGFMLSATLKISINREDKDYLSKIVTTVTFVKLCLCLFTTVIFALLVANNSTLKGDAVFYMLYMVAFAVSGFYPDYFYRGIEDMKVVTIRTLSVKTLSTSMVFLFINRSEDSVYIPLFLLIGNLVSLIYMFTDVHKRSVRIIKISLDDIKREVKDAIPFFIFQISSATYQALNTIVLGAQYGNSAVVGHYTSADRLVSLSKIGASPIADSIFPYMVRNKNYMLIKRLLFVAMPVITVGVTICWIYATPICEWLFGEEFIEAGSILRALLPIAWVTLPTYLLAFPVLVPMGLSNYANFSSVLGMIVQLLLLGVLFFYRSLTVINLCIITSVTECTIFLYRLLVALFFRKRCASAPE